LIRTEMPAAPLARPNSLAPADAQDADERGIAFADLLETAKPETGEDEVKPEAGAETPLQGLPAPELQVPSQQAPPFPSALNRSPEAVMFFADADEASRAAVGLHVDVDVGPHRPSPAMAGAVHAAHGGTTPADTPLANGPSQAVETVTPELRTLPAQKDGRTAAAPGFGLDISIEPETRATNVHTIRSVSEPRRSGSKAATAPLAEPIPSIVYQTSVSAGSSRPGALWQPAAAANANGIKGAHISTEPRMNTEINLTPETGTLPVLTEYPVLAALSGTDPPADAGALVLPVSTQSPSALVNAAQSLMSAFNGAATLPASIPPQPLLVTASPAELPPLIETSFSGSDDGPRQVIVQLDPPELGRVIIDFSFTAEGLQSVTVKGDSPEAMRVLRQMHFELVHALEQRGLSGDGLSFSQNLASGREQGHSHTPHPRFSFSPESGAPAAPSSPAPLIRPPSEGIDLRL
jgi:hypothetical protein